MKILILTTDKTLLKWYTLPQKLSNISAELAQIKDSKFSIAIEYYNIKPVVMDGHIPHLWFESMSKPFYEEGYDFVALHMSDAQRKEWGIKPRIRGINYVDNNFIGEFYFWADERTLRERHNQFEQTFLHEFRHAFMRGSLLEDDTHALHEDGDIRGSFSKLKITDYNPVLRNKEKQITLLTTILNLLKRMTKTYPFPQWTQPSQAYGVSNASWYPKTGHHLGTDFPTPIGTPIKAHEDCVVIGSGYLPKTLGFWCQVQYKDYTFVFCHLREKPMLATRAKGEVIGHTGNTGFTKGVHCHVEGWYGIMDRAKLNKNNWNTLTFEVTTKV